MASYSQFIIYYALAVSVISITMIEAAPAGPLTVSATARFSPMFAVATNNNMRLNNYLPINIDQAQWTADVAGSELGGAPIDVKVKANADADARGGPAVAVNAEIAVATNKNMRQKNNLPLNIDQAFAQSINDVAVSQPGGAPIDVKTKATANAITDAIRGGPAVAVNAEIGAETNDTMKKPQFTSESLAEIALAEQGGANLSPKKNAIITALSIRGL